MDHSEWENLERIDEELQETIEILQDGDTVSLEEARRMLGLA